MNDVTKADLRERLGNIDQIRDILFGSYLRDFTSRLEQLESTFTMLQQESRARAEEVKQVLASDLQGAVDALENKLKSLMLKEEEARLAVRQELEALSKRLTLSLEELQDDLAAELQDMMEEIEKRLKSLSSKDEEEKLEIRQTLDRLNKRVTSQIEALNDSLNQQVGTLREDLGTSRDKFQQDILGLRTQLFEDLDRRFNALTDIKVSRDDMAEMLFELGLRLKGSEFVPELRDAADAIDAANLRGAIAGGPSESEDLKVNTAGNGEVEETDASDEEDANRMIAVKTRPGKKDTSQPATTSSTARITPRRRLRGR